MLHAQGIPTSSYDTPEERDVAGADAANDQGVGCPHRHAHIQEGASVLDMESVLCIFVHSPLENIGSRIDEREEYFDAVISNGAFCLSPNKRKGFS